MSNELVTTKQVYEENPISNALVHADKLGKWMAGSAMFGCQNVEQAQLMAMTCITERITPLQFLQTYNIVKGRLAMQSGAMLAKFVSNGGDYDVQAWDAKNCEIMFTWRKKKTPYTFTLDDAKAMGLVKADSNWVKVPKNMLFWRCVSNYLRMFVPELFAGHYMIDEQLEDVVVETPTPPPQAEATGSTDAEPKKRAKRQSKTIDAEVVEESVSLSGLLVLNDLNIRATHTLLKSKGWAGDWIDEDTFFALINAYDDGKASAIRKGIESGIFCTKVAEIAATMEGEPNEAS